ncbi:MAG: TonB-dependent receptor domain-containing protein [Parvularculaceae bacterium]
MQTLLAARRGPNAALMGASFLALAVAAPAAAQDASAPTDEIVVTGSRIARDPNIEAPNPVTSLDQEAVTLSGDINVVDIVNDVPALITSSNTADNGSAGSSILNLRNLGIDRTLVLVNGRRHVAGVAGTAAVDVNTIPAALVERVDVLTGGASAIYGSDAVTGVVNFIMKDDFEGFETRVQASADQEFDAPIYFLSTTAGLNFAGGRGNIAGNFTYERASLLRQGERAHTRGDRIATDGANPALRVQAADIQAFGLNPLLLGDTILSYCGAGDPTLGAGFTALCNRASSAKPFIVADNFRFGVSNYGSIIGVDFYGDGFLSFYPFVDDGAGGAIPDPSFNFGADGVLFDFDNNGIEDCLQTANGTINQRFGGFAGCHVVDTPGGPARPFRDGLISSDIDQFGGDGTFTGRDSQTILPQDQRFNFNVIGKFEFSPAAVWFGEAKYVRSKTYTEGASVNSFYDSIPIPIDNPYIPANLRTAIETFVNDNPADFDLDNVLVFVGRDPTDFGNNRDETKRETMRFVTGFRGDLTETLRYEISGNYGRTEFDSFDGNAILLDRLYASIDAVDAGGGNIVCRSELDPTAEPGAAFLPNRGVFPGFNTFTPGSGACVPVNLFGVGAPSQAAVDFFTTTLRQRTELEQYVVSGFVSGDSSPLFELPAGAIGFAAGAEWRKESSDFRSDDLEKPLCNPGEIFIVGVTDPGTCSVPFIRGNPQSAVFDPTLPIVDAGGSYSVWEVFGEISAPLLRDSVIARELTIDAAVRFADYTTVGGTLSWQVGGRWKPHDNLTFRGTFSKTVRAPNIDELFSGATAATARPQDPCDAGAINNGSTFRPINCAADGLPPGFTDPLTARISGTQSGNPNLSEERATTWTVGFVLQPDAAPGLTITADWYDIRIKDAIVAPGLQEIVNACYDLETFPNQFCDLFERDTTSGSPTLGGLSTFRISELNFAAIETKGVDYQVRYEFDLPSVPGDFAVGVIGNYTDRIDRFEDPLNPAAVNPELYENGQARHSFNLNAAWRISGLTLNWQSQYLGNILQFAGASLQIENADQFENAFAGDTWRHDLSAIYRLSDRVQIFGGVNNLLDRNPIQSSATYPVGILGRQFFLGADLRF